MEILTNLNKITLGYKIFCWMLDPIIRETFPALRLYIIVSLVCKQIEW